MKTYLQTDENDCGISVTKSLINHFFGLEISSQTLYKYAVITSEGISILELEKLNKEFGILLESFSIDFDEFQELENNRYYATLINLNHKSHYVILRKFKKYVLIFDSQTGERKMSINQFKYDFLNLIITIECDRKFKKGAEELKDNFVFFDYLKISKVFLIDLVLLFCFFTGIYLNKFIFSDVINAHNLSNLGVIIFLFVLLYIAWTFGEFTKAFLNSKAKKNYLKSLYSKLFTQIEKKKNYFYSKLSESNFLHLHQHVQNISIFVSEYINVILINSVVLLCFVIYFLFINAHFLFIVCFSFLCQGLYCFKNQEIKKKYYPELMKYVGEQKKLFFELDNFLKNEWNKDKLSDLIFNLKNKLIGEINCEERLNWKNIFFEKINFFFFNFTNLSIYVFGAYLYFLKKISIEQLIISSFLFFYINKSFCKLIEVYFFYEIYKKSFAVYKNWIYLENGNKKGGFPFVLPSKIKIKNLCYHNGKKQIFKDLNLDIKNQTFISGKSGSGKSTLYKFICNKLFSVNKTVYFDDFAINEINDIEFTSFVIYQHNASFLDKLDWGLIFNNLELHECEMVKNYLNDFQIEIETKINFENLSSGQKQFLNILNLIKYAGKVLLLDEVASHINHENKVKIYKNLLPIIAKKNFVVCSEHNASVQCCFPNCINLDLILNA